MGTSSEAVNENTDMVVDASTHFIEPSPLANDTEIKRIRKILLVILTISLVLWTIGVITVSILWLVIIQQVILIGLLLMSVLFYGFGIFAVYQNHQAGLRVFGWLCTICLIILGIAIVASLIIFIMTIMEMNGTRTSTGKFTGNAMVGILVLIIWSITFLILCVPAFIIKLIIAILTFKVAKLIDGSKRSTTDGV